MKVSFEVYRAYPFLFLSLLLFQCSSGTASAVQARSNSTPPRERTRLHTDWRFQRFENIPDGVVYDTRPDTDENVKVLKPWILPSSNEFIENAEEHHLRPTNPPDIDIPFASLEYNDGNWTSVRVPHDWAIELPFLEGDDPVIPTSMGKLPVHGVGWYRRPLSITSHELNNKKIYLDLDGAMSYPMVWINGHLVGGWPYGYNSFRLDITPHLKAGDKNLLAIRVENPRGKSSRWYPGAGLYRNVWLTKVNPTHVAHWGTFATSRDVSSEEATVDITVQALNTGNDSQTVDVKTEIRELNPHASNGRIVAQVRHEKVKLSAGEKSSASQSVRIKNPRLWGPPPSQRPSLYVANTRLYAKGVLLDEYETRFGIRSMKFDSDKGFFINGEHILFQGVNQHHDLGALGAAFNGRAAERQLETLQDIGVNAIRMSHNPPAPELLDLADRMGFLIVNEIFDSWADGKLDLDSHLYFGDWKEPDLRSLIRRDRNHPSVIMWSYGNEIKEQNGADEEAAKISSFLRRIANSEDSSRPTTASMHFSSPNMSLPTTQEIISLNYQGEGMRFGPAYEDLEGGIRKLPQYDAFHSTFPDRLILGSEVASSLSTRGSFNFPVTPYNSAPLNDSSGGNNNTRTISAYELYTTGAGSSPDRVFLTQDTHPFVAGGFVWTGWDYLGEPFHYTEHRSSSFGIIDLAGFKKERAWIYQARWRPGLPMARIVPHWNWPDRKSKITPVHVFSSGNEAELFLNGVSQGSQNKRPLEHRFRWDNITYTPGELRVVTYKNGKVWARHTVQTTDKAAKLRLTADRASIVADGEDLSFVTVEVIDKNGLVVPDAQNKISFSVSGPGEIVATDNGKPDDFTAFRSKERRAFNGLALAIVRADSTRGGVITVKAESKDLESSTITLEATKL